MILVLHIFDSLRHVSLFQGFRITQPRTMVLSIIHGLRPNPKLKAILLLGLYPGFPQLLFAGILPCVYTRFTHITNLQSKFFIGSAMHHSWTGSTADPESIFSSATTSLFKLNSLFGSGVSIKISTFGPRFLFVSVVLTIDALNLHSFKNGNLALESCTCFFNLISCRTSFTVPGDRLSQEPACRISTSLLQFGYFLVRLSGYGDGNLSSFSGLFIDPFLSVRCNGSVFARQMHFTTEFAMTILSKCVGRVCWSFDLVR